MCWFSKSTGTLKLPPSLASQRQARATSTKLGAAPGLPNCGGAVPTRALVTWMAPAPVQAHEPHTTHSCREGPGQQLRLGQSRRSLTWHLLGRQGPVPSRLIEEGAPRGPHSGFGRHDGFPRQQSRNQGWGWDQGSPGGSSVAREPGCWKPGGAARAACPACGFGSFLTKHGSSGQPEKNQAKEPGSSSQ